MSATTPATCGPAIEVPDISPYSSPGMEETMASPGAATSGLTRPSMPGPFEDHGVMAPSMSVAPTAMTFS